MFFNSLINEYFGQIKLLACVYLLHFLDLSTQLSPHFFSLKLHDTPLVAEIKYTILKLKTATKKMH